MLNINDYLKKFSGIVNNKHQAYKIVSSEVQKILGIEIKKQAVEIKEGILYLKESPIIKNTIFFNKKMILENMQRAGLKIVDIR